MLGLRLRLMAIGLVGVGACFGQPPADSESASTSSSSSGVVTTDTDISGTSSTSEATGIESGSGTAGDTSGSTDSGATDTEVDPTIVFYDDFERPDSLALGNGWVEKTPDAWRLLTGSVQFEANPAGFDQDFIMQPTIDVRDAEVSVEFRIATVDLEEYPQVHARIDPVATQIMGESRSYGVFVDVLESELIVLRNVGTQITSFPGSAFATAIVPERLYRVTIRISGIDPVAIEGTLERDDGGRWQPHAFVSVVDAGPERITDVGAVGTSGNFNIAGLSYDNFSVRQHR